MTALDYALWMVYEGRLFIDTEGRIWRTGEIRRDKWVKVPWRRAENVGGKGYLRLTLQMPDTKRLRSVQAHKVLWVARHGPIPEGQQINHKNLKKQDNRDDNLELQTPSGNMRHSYANGGHTKFRTPLLAKYERGAHHNAKINDGIVREIRTLKSSLSYSQLSARFGLGTGHLVRIVNRKAWSHVI